MSSIKKLYKDKKECLKYNQKIIEDYIFNNSPKKCEIANIDTLEILEVLLVIKSPHGLLNCINGITLEFEITDRDMVVFYGGYENLNIRISLESLQKHSDLFIFDKENVGYYLSNAKKLANNWQQEVDKLQREIRNAKKYYLNTINNKNILIKLMEE